MSQESSIHPDDSSLGTHVTDDTGVEGVGIMVDELRYPSGFWFLLKSSSYFFIYLVFQLLLFFFFSIIYGGNAALIALNACMAYCHTSLDLDS